MKNFTYFAVYVAIVFFGSSCRTTKVDFATAYKFSTYNYAKKTSVTPAPDLSASNTLKKVDAIEVDGHLVSELIPTPQVNIFENLENIKTSIKQSLSSEVNASNGLKKITREEKRDLKKFLISKVKEAKKELKNRKDITSSNNFDKNAASNNVRLGIILAAIGLILTILGVYPLDVIGIILLIVGLVFILLELI